MLISIKKELGSCFESDEYVINLSRKFEGYEQGDLIISGTPFDITGDFPLQLEIAIRKNGDLIFRSWKFINHTNSYFHTAEDYNKPYNHFEPTQEQLDTVSGLFSGRIKFEGLKLSIGGSIQKVCPIDIKKEEEKVNKKIYIM